MSEATTTENSKSTKDKPTKEIKKNPFRGIPEYRIDETVSEDIKRIYQQVRGDDIYSGDLARIFNLKVPGSGRFYERLYSLMYYGLLEQKVRGRYALTNIAKGIVDPNDDEEKIRSYKKAVLSVPLWKELSLFPKLPSHIWISIKKITKLTTDEAQEIDSTVREWFVHDYDFVQNLSRDIESPEHNNYSLDYNTIPSLNTQNTEATTQLRSSIQNNIGRLLLKVDGNIFDIPIYSTASFKLALNTLNLVAEQLHVSIQAKDIEVKNTNGKETNSKKALSQDIVTISTTLPGDVEYPQ